MHYGGCYKAGSTAGKSQMTAVVPSAGRWTVYIYQWDLRTSDARIAYELVAYVQHRTKTVLTAPKLVGVGKRFTIRGKTLGVDVGQSIALTISGAGLPARQLAVPVAADGSFSWTGTMRKRGSYVAQASFPGDDNHMASSATVTIRALPPAR